METLNLKYIKRENAFTFFEMILVIMIFGVLGSIALQRIMSLAEDAEIINEDTVIGVMRSNITNNFLEKLAKSDKAQYAVNPFENLTNVPDGYDRRRNFPPNGLKIDDTLWVFIPGGGTGTAINAEGESITSGEIWHQRRDHTTVKWNYNPASGVISAKIIVQKSDLKRLLQAYQRRIREPTEDDIRLGRRFLDFQTLSETEPIRERSDEQ